MFVGPPGVQMSLSPSMSHRFAVSPAVGLLAVEIFFQILAPKFLAARLAADQHAVRREDINAIAVDRRRAARALPIGLALVPGGAGLRLPQLLAVGLVEADEILVFVVGRGRRIAERVDPAVDNRQARITAARPAAFQTSFGPSAGHSVSSPCPARRPFAVGREMSANYRCRRSRS